MEQKTNDEFMRNILIEEAWKEVSNYFSWSAENGGYPPTQNGDIRSLFWLFSLMALQN